MPSFVRLVTGKLHSYGLVQVHWVRRSKGSLLEATFPRSTVWARRAEIDKVIERRAAITEDLGAKPLWSGYESTATATRSSGEVRTSAATGRLYRHLVTRLRPRVIVEVGTAFGVSGMYWLAGLELNELGHLYTFDPNRVWIEAAEANLDSIGHRYTAVNDTVEERLPEVLPAGDPIDLAFIDGIHTSAFVEPQLALVAARSRPGSIIILDDINFSADMAQCWKRLSVEPQVRAALTLGRRVGVLEMR